MPGLHRPWAALTALCLGLLTAGCPTPLTGLNVYKDDTTHPGFGKEGPEKVEVRYLGVGGYFIRRGEDRLLFAPSFTNPSFVAGNPFNTIHSDAALVDRCLKKGVSEDELRRVEFILVGHAHYDHLMDVPRVMQRHAPRALALGSRTMSHTLAGAGLASRTLIVDGCAASRGGDSGRWFYNDGRTVRVMALESEHSPHLGFIKLMTGHYTVDRASLPRSPFGWKEGQTYAYLVDFLNPDGSVDFRLHYQDAASHEGYGAIPASVLQEHPRVDLAITCVGAHASIEGYPGPFLKSARPRHVVLGHWEDFFANQQCGEKGDPDPLVVRLAQPKGFISLVEKNAPQVPWLMPYPYSRMYFPRAMPEPRERPATVAECPTRPGELPKVSAPVESALDAAPRF